MSRDGLPLVVDLGTGRIEVWPAGTAPMYVGDLAVRPLGPDEPCPSGWTMAGDRGYCTRTLTGTELLQRHRDIIVALHTNTPPPA